ncbi:MAG: 4Fe-4S binding protein [candidate division Zixibacteria bacterium]|nr:4Fe-4S binding protein [candidate division Zixibacteria bacterium]
MQTGLLSTYLKPLKTRHVGAWTLSSLLIGFFLIFYFTVMLDARLLDLGVGGKPLASLLNSATSALGLSNKWWLYSWLYTLAMVIGGVFFLSKHAKTPYQRWRTITVVMVQIVFVMALPYLMVYFEKPVYNFAMFWPLKHDTFYPGTTKNLPELYMMYSIVGAFFLVPALTFLFGKRWYCSWACGCGGLAETAGDSFRHLSNKSTNAWRFERYSIHLVLLFVIINTILVIIHFKLRAELGASYTTEFPTFSSIAVPLALFYKFMIASLLSGVLGVGLYPLMGSRVWCRFFCPLAALMGIIQKYGRFRITVKDDMCISCGNCSTYCEMGIDVRAYAQKNQSFKRASCVGCGMCEHVCPRGVLKLENKWDFASWGKDPARNVAEI